MATRVSIIIAVYDDPRLDRCLAAITSQTFDRTAIQIIVVENGSKNMQAICEQYGVNYFWIFDKNLSIARNVGLQKALGEFVLITDSDCVPERDWVERMVEYMDRNPAVIHAGGIIRSFAPTTSVQRYGSTLVDGQQSVCFLFHIAPFPYIVTANAIFRRMEMITVGGFDPELKSGSDVDISYKLFLLGHSPSICEAAQIWHQERVTVGQHYRRFYRYAYYQVLLFKKYRSITGRTLMINTYPLKCFLRAVVIPLVNIMTVLRGDVGPIWRSWLLFVEGFGVLIGNFMGAICFRVPYL